MSARVQSSPFRETEWDQRLDRMLDDLKSTVTDDEDRRTPLGIRSSSRSSSRAGSVGRRGDGVGDGGRLTHHRKEYTSPDSSVRTVADTYQYDSGDTHPSGNYQKKVVKSTYSSYNVDGGLSQDLDSLKRGPSDRDMERALTQESRNILNSNYVNKTTSSSTVNNSKVVDASQDVARELVGALSCIGSDSETEDPSTSRSRWRSDSSGLRQQQRTTVKQETTSQTRLSTQSGGSSSHHRSDVKQPKPLDDSKSKSMNYARSKSLEDARHYENALRIYEERDSQNPGPNNSDYSTLGRLKRNIKELGGMIDDMDREEMERLNRRYLGHASDVQHVDQRRSRSQGHLNATRRDVAVHDTRHGGRSLSNGHYDDDVIVNDEKSGEVRRIVWRNRYEKTYETNDATTPTVTIEKDARNRRYQTLSTDTDATTLSSLTRPHVPPQISPGGMSWAEPVPLPTPPQVSPGREPGVAYIYNYGSSGGSAVQPLPPLNYVAVAPPTSEGAPSPTPSALTTGQPVIYHYSYHYTIQPGQALPEGAHPHGSPPALQIVPPPATGYSTSANTATSAVNKSTTLSEVHHHTTNRDIRHHHATTSTTSTGDRPPRDREPLDPNYHVTRKGPYPDDEGGKPPSSTNINYAINTTNYRTDTTSGSHPPFPTDNIRRDPSLDDHRDPPGRPNDPHRNVTININKSTTHTTHTTTRDGGEYPHGDNQTPLTSTPYRGRSRSPERRYPSGPSDSLERVRRHPQPGLPFPDTSPVRPQNDSRIPRKVDDLMHEFPVKNGGPHTTGYHMHPDAEPLLADTDVRHGRRTRTDITLLPPERNEINTVSPSRLREEREKTKNQAGPPVYYPPGHEAFSESMHTMTLKEGGRRGKAKWRREAASGYKESSAHSESKGGMAMVPVCLPLCCGAACTIM